MNPIEEILASHPVMILDGALATELERRGCDLNDPLWSAKVLIEQPDLIRQVHYDYFAAGADCATTASYQASIEGFARRGLNQAEAVELMKKSVDLAQQARDAFWADERNRAGRPRPIVAGSVGPYGAYLADGSEYRGEYGRGKSELIQFHRPRMEALVAAGADILACETLPSFLEAQALVELLSEFPSTFAWFSFTARDEVHISEGDSFTECVAWLDQFPQVAAVGINCSAPKYVPALIRAAKSVTSKPILVYPNSGEVYDAATNTWSGIASCEAYGAESQKWYEAGARIIGGCCRTTPEDIRVVAAWARM